MNQETDRFETTLDKVMDVDGITDPKELFAWTKMHESIHHVVLEKELDLVFVSASGKAYALKARRIPCDDGYTFTVLDNEKVIANLTTHTEGRQIVYRLEMLVGYLEEPKDSMGVFRAILKAVYKEYGNKALN